MACGIILAGGIYPVVLAAIAGLGVTWHLVMENSGPIRVWDLLYVLTAMLFVGCAGGLVGFVWSSLVLLFTLPLVYLFFRSLDLRENRVALGAMWGGFVGFIAVLPFMIGFRQDPVGWPNELLGWTLALATGPGLTIVLGQIGGAWAASRPSYEEMIARARVHDALAPANIEVPVAAAENDPPAHSPIRFTVRQMLWIAVWISLALTAIRLFGLPFEFMLPLVGGWLVYQAATNWLGGVLARRLEPWWQRRRVSRST